MKGLQVSAEWKPREGYAPTERETARKEAFRADVLWYNPKLEMIEKEIPAPKDDEVLMKVGGVGVCGSDTMFLGADEAGYSRFPGHSRFPCIIGHEYAGEVAAVGKNVKNLKPGDLITAETMNWCGECMSCRKGMFNQCENLEEIGFTLDGGFAEYLVAKEKFCFTINEFAQIYGGSEKAMIVGALIEPACVAYNGLVTRGGGFDPGNYVTVFGCGPVGLSAIAIAKAAGAAKVIAFDLMEERLVLAKKMGADLVFNPAVLNKNGIRPSGVIMQETKGVGAHMQVEATESKVKTLPEIEDSMAVGGKIIQIGISSGLAPITSFKLQAKGVSYHCTIGSAGHGIWPNVIRLMSFGLIRMENMIHSTFALKDAIKAIETAKAGAAGKIVVTPNL